MKILIGPTEIAGIASGLKQGFLELGVQADVVVARPHPFGYEGLQHGGLNGLWQLVGLLRNRYASRVIGVFFDLTHGVLKWLVFFRALFVYDAFIFLFSKTLTNTRFELMSLRLLRKRIIFIYVGSDVRPPYMGAIGQTYEPTSRASDRLMRRTRDVKQRVALHERFADYIVNSPSTAQFQEQRFINWFSMGVPRHFTVDMAAQESHSTCVRILHAPSKPLTKGTPRILEIIERLKTKGHAIDLVMIQGMPNQRVLEELSRCDFIVDEMYSDTPMAIFATEAAYFGKPAVVGGYFAAEMEANIESAEIPPSLFVHPDHVEAAIERLIVDVCFRKELGQQARNFVQQHWAPKAVAGRYLQLMQGDVPSFWWFYPERVRYVYGCGVLSNRLKLLLSSYIASKGLAALQVSHNPKLEAGLAALISDYSSAGQSKSN